MFFVDGLKIDFVNNVFAAIVRNALWVVDILMLKKRKDKNRHGLITI